MGFYRKHTEETKKKMAEAQRRRYANETSESKALRIGRIRNAWAKASEELRLEREREQRERYEHFIQSEYIRLFSKEN